MCTRLEIAISERQTRNVHRRSKSTQLFDLETDCCCCCCFCINDSTIDNLTTTSLLSREELTTIWRQKTLSRGLNFIAVNSTNSNSELVIDFRAAALSYVIIPFPLYRSVSIEKIIIIIHKIRKKMCPSWTAFEHLVYYFERKEKTTFPFVQWWLFLSIRAH